jgi:hypothetical protein
MFEYIQFYTKNLSNFTLLIVVGVVIAILDITFRNIIKDVYLNVRENMKQNNAGKEGLVNKNTATGSGSGSDGSGGSSDTNVCPKSCSDVEALRTKLTRLIENAARLQQDIQNNNTTIQRQQFLIQQMQKSVQKLVEKSKK